MSSVWVFAIIIILLPVFMLVMNKVKCSGKAMAVILRDGLPIDQRLCKVVRGFIVYNGCGYYMYDDLHRDMRYPAGYPSFMQETVKAYLIDEHDGVPLPWALIEEKPGMRMKRARELGACFDSEMFATYLKKSTEQGATLKGRFNWKRALPFALIALAILGVLGYFMFLR
jgi:hypothetical protein